jgi:glycosyltransferase involved in cell wall biosynthesis
VNPAGSSILLIAEADIATTQLIEQLLQACRPFGIHYRKVYLNSFALRDLNRRTVPLFVRCGDPGLKLWIELLRRARHPYLYYIDDNFWELRDNSALGEYYRDPGVRESLEVAVCQAGLVLTNSEVLASYLQRFTPRLRVLPSFFDFALIEGCLPEPTEELRVGFAGSPSRIDDLDLIRPVIQPVLDRVPSAVFEFCGVLPRDTQPSGRIRFFGHVDSYEDFIRFQAKRNWAIGLAPLRDHAANRAKTNNKYREYGACGIAAVYSDMPPYSSCVRQGITGLLAAPSSEAWLSAILSLALSAGERELMAKRAREDVREKYSVETVAGAWAGCIREIHSELRQHPSRLVRAYLGRILLADWAHPFRILRLQVQDAYGKGGVPLVLLKTGQRLSSGLVKALGLRDRGQ